MTVRRSVHRITVKRRHALQASHKTQYMGSNRRIIHLSPNGSLVGNVIVSTLSRVNSYIGAIHFRVRRMARPFVRIAGLFRHLHISKVSDRNGGQLRLFRSKDNLLNQVNFVGQGTCHTSNHTYRVSRAPLMANKEMGSRRTSNLSSGASGTLHRNTRADRRLTYHRVVPLPDLVVLPLYSGVVQVLLHAAQRRHVCHIVVHNTMNQL